MTKTNSLTGATLTDHTVTTASGLVAGFLVRKHGRDLGHVWTAGGVWHWRSASGRNFGERKHKAVAVQALLDAFAFYAAQRDLRIAGPLTIAPTVRTSTAAPRAAPAPASAPAPAPRKQEIVWGTANTGGDLRQRIADGLKKAGAK